MALTWDARNVEGFDTLDDNETVTLDALIWATAAIGINSITVENVREFYTRVSFYEKVIGAYRFADGSPLYFTPEDVLRFAGLKTNASVLTMAKFRNHVYDCHGRFNVPASV